MTGADGKRPRWELSPRLRMAAWILLAVGIVGVLALAFRPQPVGVDIAVAERGDLEVSVEEDGRTRFRERYVVSSPVAGELFRVTLEPGDLVPVGAVLARIGEPAPVILDPRSREQVEVRLAAAEAGVERARAMVEVAGAALVDAREELRRQQILFETGGGSESARTRAEALVRAREAEVNAAVLSVRGAESEVEDLLLTLSRPSGQEGGGVVVRAPAAGIVLAIHQESAGMVAPGQPLFELGDPNVVEVVVDLLSADAARVSEGAEASITGWGGDEPLRARVRRVDPAGFTRLSALGIEEQRVNVFLDLYELEESGIVLGDGYRVEVRILIDRVENTLRIPTSALFRRGDGWAVFKVEEGRVGEAPVEVGKRSQALAEIVSGLSEGDRVVVYPSDRVAEGVRVRERE